MAKFVFKLEGVLKERKNAERQRLLELGVIQKDMTALRNNSGRSIRPCATRTRICAKIA